MTSLAMCQHEPTWHQLRNIVVALFTTSVSCEPKGVEDGDTVPELSIE